MQVYIPEKRAGTIARAGDEASVIVRDGDVEDGVAMGGVSLNWLGSY